VRGVLALDLVILAALALAALTGAASGGLRQVVQLAAVVLAAVAARTLSAPVARGLGTAISPVLARGAAPAVVFLGSLALASLVLGALLRATGLSRAVRGPADRAAGAVLSGAKAALGAWVLLSALAVVGNALPWLGRQGEKSQFASFAREHNLLERLAPDQVQAVEDLGKKLP
jgi:membrane protein required for colicin V production